MSKPTHYRSFGSRITSEPGKIYLEPSPRWIRGYAKDGTKIVDSKRVYIGWEGSKKIPFWAFPESDVLQDLSVRSHVDAGKDGVRDKWYDVKLSNGTIIEKAAWTYREDTPGYLKDEEKLVVFEFTALDKWLEDDEQVVGHARSPYAGLNTRLSSRSVKVVIEGVTVAETNSAIFLYENGHPTRYYINVSDVVGLHYFSPSTYHSACAYKGVASYFNAKINSKEIENVVWTYPEPAAEVARIQGRWSFWNESVDIYVDDELIPRPQRYIVHTAP